MLGVKDSGEQIIDVSLECTVLGCKGKGEKSEMQCKMSAQRKLEVHSYGLQMVKQSWLGELCWKDFGVKLT